MSERSSSGTTYLRPCPFCGDGGVMLRINPAVGNWVSCQSCGLEAPTETGTTADQAVEYWNRRSSDVAQASREEEIRAYWHQRMDRAQERIRDLETALQVFFKVLRGGSSYVPDSYELHVNKAEYGRARDLYDKKASSISSTPQVTEPPTFAQTGRCCAHLWVCTGCGTRKSMEQIKGETPQAIACCPERKMAPVSVECPNCHNANKYGDYEGPTCDVCLGDGFVDGASQMPSTDRQRNSGT